MFNCFVFASARRAMSVLGVAGLLLACFSAPLFGQNAQTTASLSGVVTDPQGARVAGATVTATNQNQGFTRTFTTDAAGTYSFSFLPPSIYSVKVEASGFKRAQQDKVTLEVGQAATLNFSLTVGSAQETVQVTGQAPLLNTDDANVATQINTKQILDLPLSFRNPVFFTFLDAAVYNIDEGYMGGGLDNNDQAVSFMDFGGEYLGSTFYSVDGAWDTSLSVGQIAYTPSVEEIQEFKVLTYGFTAQYALSTGNAVTMITKSGTSKFHGDVYEFLRNSALDANYYLNAYYGLPKNNLKLNQFGGTLGGPVMIPGVLKGRDKTFFFVLYEGYRSSGTSPLAATAPTSDFKSGNLSALLGPQIGMDALCRPIYAGQIYNPYAHAATATCATANNTVGQAVEIRDPIAGNMITSIDPVASALLPYFPSPTGSGIANNFYADQAVPITSNEFTARIDHNITDNARIYGKISRKWVGQTSVGALYGNDPGGPYSANENHVLDISLGYNQVSSPTLTASMNLGFIRLDSFGTSQGYPFKPSTLGLPAS